jgi:fimbrial chaperone protein
MAFLTPRATTWSVASLFVKLALCSAATSWAGTFQVSPTRVFLSAESSSALLTLRNDSNETLRFQLSVVAWDQSPQGEILLKPTDDIVFFPSLVTVAPGDERKIRTGVLTPTTATEKTYRIFVEELPSQNPEAMQKTTQVRLLTRLGIPIFLQPNKRKIEGRVDDLALRKGLFSFQLKNTGNVHFVTQDIRVRGYGPSETLFERELEGWYILAGGFRVYEFELPKNNCAKLKTLAVEVKTEESTLTENLDISAGSCAQ